MISILTTSNEIVAKSLSHQQLRFHNTSHLIQFRHFLLDFVI